MDMGESHDEERGMDMWESHDGLPDPGPEGSDEQGSHHLVEWPCNLTSTPWWWGREMEERGMDMGESHDEERGMDTGESHDGAPGSRARGE